MQSIEIADDKNFFVVSMISIYEYRTSYYYVNNVTFFNALLCDYRFESSYWLMNIWVELGRFYKKNTRLQKVNAMMFLKFVYTNFLVFNNVYFVYDVLWWCLYSQHHINYLWLYKRWKLRIYLTIFFHITFPQNYKCIYVHHDSLDLFFLRVKCKT